MVLRAEDEEVNSLYIQEILKQSKDPYFKIIHAKNGKDAVEICKNKKIDLVLMDIKMPIMNGYDATKKIKKINPSIPIIALTAFSTEMDRNKAMAAGCDEFISKPVRKFEFFRTLTQFIKVKST
jgi:CheY-like chemotaxis protein